LTGALREGTLDVLITNHDDDYYSAFNSDVQVIFDTTYSKLPAEFFLERGQIDVFALFALNSFPSFVRVIISIVFVGSFLLRPLVIRPISLVWARIVESDKPVFTLVFGGAAAFATAISEAAKHL
jgi:hypothetical protein